MSLTRWYELRKQKDNPTLAQVDATPEGVGLLSADYDWVFIDTPPAIIDIIEDAISASDVVLIPARPSAVDVLAMDDVAYLCERQGKPFAFVMNAVVAAWGSLTDGAIGYLRNIGPVLESRVGMRKPFVSAMTTGRSGAELDRAAAKEIDALWSELQVFARKAARRPRANVR
jgi:chromosome partitioning protein